MIVTCYYCILNDINELFDPFYPNLHCFYLFYGSKYYKKRLNLNLSKKDGKVCEKQCLMKFFFEEYIFKAYFHRYV